MIATARSPHPLSSAELLLGVQLEQAGIAFQREVRFHPTRRWRFDFAWVQPGGGLIAVEIDGGSWIAGRHSRGKGFEADLEKLNTAVLRGWRVLRFTPAMVEDGRALAVIRAALERQAA